MPTPNNPAAASKASPVRGSLSGAGRGVVPEQLLSLAERFEAEAIRIAGNAINPIGVVTSLAATSAHCFTIAAALRARAAQ